MSTAVDNGYSNVSSRPIRPLPKRRLRSRLSEDANTALFAPPQQPPTPLFYFPFNNYAGDSTVGGSGAAGYGAGHGLGDGVQDSSDDEDNSNASVSLGMVSAGAGSGDGGLGGADPYEWTENSNNKKKRKIPTHTNPGGSTVNGGMGGGYGGTSHTSPGFSPTSTPRNRWKLSGPSQRSPLSAKSTASHASLRRPSRRYPTSPSVDSFNRLSNGKDSGSNTEEPATPSKSKNRPPVAQASGVLKQTQFTFVCESPVLSSLSYTPGLPSGGGGSAPTEGTTYPKSVHTVGTQTSPNMSNTHTPPQAPQPTKKKAHKLSRREQFAQQQRRRRQEALANSHNNNGEIWICEFCEYESIFGEPPEALMRQYEIKDRKERRRLAEKRRLLEKAKQKGKKNAYKSGSGRKASGQHGTAPPPPPPPSATDSQGTHSDSTPLASTTPTPATKPARHSQQVQTDACPDGNHHHSSSGRGTSQAKNRGGGAGPV